MTKKELMILKGIGMGMSVSALVFLFILDWKIAICIFFILLANKINLEIKGENYANKTNTDPGTTKAG